MKHLSVESAFFEVAHEMNIDKTGLDLFTVIDDTKIAALKACVAMETLEPCNDKRLIEMLLESPSDFTINKDRAKNSLRNLFQD